MSSVIEQLRNAGSESERLELAGVAYGQAIKERLAPLTPEQQALYDAVDWKSAFGKPEEPADVARLFDACNLRQLQEATAIMSEWTDEFLLTCDAHAV